MRYLPFFLVLLLFLCTCDRAVEKDTSGEERTENVAATSETPLQPAKAIITDVCDLMTESFILSALPAATEISFIPGTYMGVIGCKAKAMMEGKPYTITIVYQTDATDAAGFKKMLTTMTKLADLSEEMVAPVMIAGVGDQAYVQAGTNGAAGMLRGRDLWKAIVQDADNHNDAAYSEALLRKIP